MGRSERRLAFEAMKKTTGGLGGYSHHQASNNNMQSVQNMSPSFPMVDEENQAR